MNRNQMLALSTELGGTSASTGARDTTANVGPRRLEDHLARVSPATSRQSVAALIDLVAVYRPDLLEMFVGTLRQGEAARGYTEELIELIEACGPSQADEPCRFALAVAADLDALLKNPEPWSHPAQVVKKPAVRALRALCAHRLERAQGSAAEQLREILPRLELAATLEEKAAARRGHRKPAAAPPAPARNLDWLSSWLPQ